MATKKKLTGHEHVRRLLEEFDTLMVGTYEATGSEPSLRARPMAIAKLEDDLRICFLTHISTSKVEQAMAPRHGQISGQSKRRYIALTGTFELSDDKERIRSMWSPAFDVWFAGPDDPAIVLMIFRPEVAEVWDNGGTRGLKYAFEAARALVTGERPSTDGNPEQHERIALH